MGFVGNVDMKREVCKSLSRSQWSCRPYDEARHPTTGAAALQPARETSVAAQHEILKQTERACPPFHFPHRSHESFSHPKQTPSVSCGNVCLHAPSIHHCCQTGPLGSLTHRLTLKTVTLLQSVTCLKFCCEHKFHIEPSEATLRHPISEQAFDLRELSGAEGKVSRVCPRGEGAAVWKIRPALGLFLTEDRPWPSRLLNMSDGRPHMNKSV